MRSARRVRNRRFAARIAGASLLACGAALAIAGCALTHNTTAYQNPAASFGRLEAGFKKTGLHVCSQSELSWRTQGFVQGKAYVVAADCAAAKSTPVASVITVSQYDSAKARDTAEQQANVFARYMATHTTTIWSYGPFLITVSGSRSSGSARLLTQELRKLGAVG